MVTNVTSLLKTVKTVEDENARGTRALEASIEAIGQDIRVSGVGTSSIWLWITTVIGYCKHGMWNWLGLMMT